MTMLSLGFKSTQGVLLNPLPGLLPGCVYKHSLDRGYILSDWFVYLFYMYETRTLIYLRGVSCVFQSISSFHHEREILTTVRSYLCYVYSVQTMEVYPNIWLINVPIMSSLLSENLETPYMA